MSGSIAVVGAPSSIGIRPYEDGVARHLDWAPRILRERDLVGRLGAIDLGDVVPPSYRDYVRPPCRARNEREVLTYSRSLAGRVADAIGHEAFSLVLGGDCSIVLGCLLGARRAAGSPIGLAYVDAHADFATPEESRTGSVSGMSLSFATGRGGTPLARLTGRTPLVDGRHVALLGRRDRSGARGGRSALAASPILDLPDVELMSRGFADSAIASLARIAAPDMGGFWIHVDVDVLNPAVMPAVDSPEPGGPLPDELVMLLVPLVGHPQALGMSLAVYDPALDPDRSCARQLVSLLETVLLAR